ncbi:MAG: adenylate/guanylate cyclase domain-containing protein [Gemmataceae bacterium]|nr:adenylate/guanylate cyclase domain-containing protein [Gemmataceae bacterium]
MTQPHTVRLLVDDQPAGEAPLDDTLELGRQRAGEPPPGRLLSGADGGPARLIVAPQHAKDNISRRHLTLTPQPGGQVRVENHSQAPLDRTDPNGPPIAPGQSADLDPPFALALPGRIIRVLPPSGDLHGVSTLDVPTRGPGAGELSLDARSLALLRPDQLRTLLEGVPRALGVLQSAVGAADFLERASGALVQIIGLDSGRVLLRRDDSWEVAAAHAAAPDPDWKPSRHVLERLLQTRSAVWQRPPAAGEPDSASLRLLDAVVAAPLLDRHDKIIGALYGERRRGSPPPGQPAHGRGSSQAPAHPDSHVEALLVDLLACGTATGLARLEQEQAALKATALFEQFFTPDLARRLSADPTLLEGHQADVTVLFADIRSFSAHSERLGPAGTVRWVNDVMGELSRCVLDEGGVLVDYIGDELMAMWGAPAEQPDQAARAVRAALAMQSALSDLDKRWQEELGSPLRLGVGISSGPAQVGNTGSSYKFKYGPLGNTVNLASRVQGLTKHLRCGLLVTAGTREQLGEGFSARRVVRARVVNIEGPVDVFEVETAGAGDRGTFFAESQAAQEALERGDFAAAARQAGAMLAVHSGDGPLLLTLARAADALVRGGAGFDPVWTPPGK